VKGFELRGSRFRHILTHIVAERASPAKSIFRDAEGCARNLVARESAGQKRAVYAM
jgi:hypothetical protein